MYICNMNKKERIADLERRIKEYDKLSKDNEDNFHNLSTSEYTDWLMDLQKLKGYE